MSSTIRIYAEIVFNIAYLFIIWVLVFRMLKRMSAVKPKNAAVAQNLMIAFTLLALGDTGHVGFRVLAYYMGGLDAKLTVLSTQLPLTGTGALATAITITLFYILMLDTWRKRFDQKYGIFEYVLIIAGIVRLILFINPANQWGSAVPPFEWSIMRNVPLMIQGLGAAYLMLRDSNKHRDKTFKQIAVLILLSFACYMPVIFFVQKVSWIGMLMIPKTVAYIGIAVISFKTFFSGRRLRLVKTNNISASM